MEEEKLLKALAELRERLGKRVPGGQELPEDQEVWRYMSFAKFLSLITRRALFFPSIDTLRRMDPAEGVHFTRRERMEYEVVVGALEIIAKRKGERISGIARGNLDLTELTEAAVGSRMFVSCWHAQEHEDAAMWRSYGTEGVAVTATVGALQAALSGSGISIYAKAVQYMKPWTDDPLHWVFHKRLAYKSEREFRVVLDLRKENAKTEELRKTSYAGGGLYVPVDLRKLMKGMVVGPGSTGWLAEAVRAVRDALGLDFNVSESVVETG